MSKELGRDQLHVTYDHRGIQRFIFRVPRLRSIVGGSALVSKFGSDARRLAEGGGTSAPECLFASGGRGHFACADVTRAEKLREQLVAKVHALGMDIRIGCSESMQSAIEGAADDYSFLPAGNELDGEPCAHSGCYPVVLGEGEGYRDGLGTQRRER